MSNLHCWYVECDWSSVLHRLFGWLLLIAEWSHIVSSMSAVHEWILLGFGCSVMLGLRCRIIQWGCLGIVHKLHGWHILSHAECNQLLLLLKLQCRLVFRSWGRVLCKLLGGLLL